MKIALFRSFDSDQVFPGDEINENVPSHARISEWVEVDFPPLPDDVREQTLRKLETLRKEARDYHEQQLARIDRQAKALQS